MFDDAWIIVCWWQTEKEAMASLQQALERSGEATEALDARVQREQEIALKYGLFPYTR